MSVPVRSLALCELAKCWMSLLLSEKIQTSCSCGSDSMEFSPSRIATSSERNTEKESWIFSLDFNFLVPKTNIDATGIAASTKFTAVGVHMNSILGNIINCFMT
ncbi:uncharacterized protein TNCV_2473711 [Trichonephila clavipes]|nr:uncharacterized protein TNCV_2473711 [Trichonephila clavipes]